MGVMLFRDGDTHIIRGVNCEMKVFPREKMRSRLKEGWRKTPAADIVKEVHEEKDVVEELTEQPEEVRNLDDMPDEMIRQLANEAGIGNWHNRKIPSLKVMLRDKSNG